MGIVSHGLNDDVLVEDVNSANVGAFTFVSFVFFKKILKRWLHFREKFKKCCFSRIMTKS